MASISDVISNIESKPNFVSWIDQIPEEAMGGYKVWLTYIYKASGNKYFMRVELWFVPGATRTDWKTKDGVLYMQNDISKKISMVMKAGGWRRWYR